VVVVVLVVLEVEDVELVDPVARVVVVGAPVAWPSGVRARNTVAATPRATTSNPIGTILAKGDRARWWRGCITQR